MEAKERVFWAEQAQGQRPRGKRELRPPSWNGSAWLEGSSLTDWAKGEDAETEKAM